MKKLFYFPDWKLRWKFLFIFLTLVILPMLAFSLFIYNQANNAVQQQAIDNTKSHLEKVEDNLSAVILDIEDISSYMIYSEEFRNFLTTPDIPENRTRLKSLEDRINGYATFHLNSKPYLSSITLNGMRNSEVHIGKQVVQTDERHWQERASDLHGKVLWSEAYSVTDYWDREEKVISLFRVINDINNITNPIGMVTIRLNTHQLYEWIETDSSYMQQMFVLDQKNKVVLHQDSSYIGKLHPDEGLLKAIKGAGSEEETFGYQKDDEKYNVVKRPLEGTDLVLYAVVDKKDVAESITGMQGSIRIMMIALTVLGILAMAGFYRYNIKRIIDLTKQTQQVEKGDFSANVPVTARDEIGLLGLRFNRMVRQLKYLIENEYQMEIRNRESELKLLQSQINPHFLYNTLDMIRWTARLERAMDTGKLIEQLSKMFRISLNRGKPWISLQDELAYSHLYLQLNKKRLGKKLTYSIFYDADVSKAIVLKQMIQPLIENSLQHGFDKVSSIRNIYVRCYREEDDLVIDVMDNGVGFSQEQFQASVKGGYALQNIQDRLQIAFGDKARLIVKTKRSPGAWVRIQLPYRENKDWMDEGDLK